jgi:DNA-binding transcriptional LysR family regulator
MGAADDIAAIRVAPTIWLGEDALVEQEVLPIAVLEKPCRFRDAALAALDASGRPYRVVLETPSLSVLRAAVDAGLGVTARTRVFSDRILARQAAERLPSLPQVAYVRHTRANPHATISRLADLMNAAVIDLQPECES